ncbi:hypothetical protein C9422_27740 [Pseudomonas sp. B1(2018)]|nr:hypothetical protein C9422_27740 [Pseudomonas sp. B1(2018)]
MSSNNYCNLLFLWERACSRMRCVIQNGCRLTRRLREQARSHRGTACTSIMQAPGSGPGTGAFRYLRA